MPADIKNKIIIYKQILIIRTDDAPRCPGHPYGKYNPTNTHTNYEINTAKILNDINYYSVEKPSYLFYLKLFIKPNQLSILINLYIALHRFYQSIDLKIITPDLNDSVTNQMEQCPAQGAPKYIDKSNHNVAARNYIGIIAVKTNFLTPQDHAPAPRDDKIYWMRARVGNKDISSQLAKSPGKICGIPSRYVSRPLLTNIIILSQTRQLATPNMNRANISPQRRLTIRYPAVTTRQLLPRDSAMINPEIQVLDAVRRPAHVTFLVLSREATQTEKDSGSLGLPICRASWDFPNPDTFYDVLDQVVNLLEPAHKKPGALITAAAAPEAMRLCVIRIKNDFGQAIDFIRRAFRGATQDETILETFPIEAFFPPTAIHLEQQWARGMKRYCIINPLTLTIKNNHTFTIFH